MKGPTDFGHWLCGHEDWAWIALEVDAIRDPGGCDSPEDVIDAFRELEDEDPGHAWAESKREVARMAEAWRRLIAFEPIEPWPSTAGVYVIRRSERPEEVKIGVALRVVERLKAHQAMAPRPIQLIAVTPGGRNEETRLHRKFKRYRINGGGGSEWYRLEGHLWRAVFRWRTAAA